MSVEISMPFAQVCGYFFIMRRALLNVPSGTINSSCFSAGRCRLTSATDMASSPLLQHRWHFILSTVCRTWPQDARHICRIRPNLCHRLVISLSSQRKFEGRGGLVSYCCTGSPLSRKRDPFSVRWMQIPVLLQTPLRRQYACRSREWPCLPFTVMDMHDDLGATRHRLPRSTRAVHPLQPASRALIRLPRSLDEILDDEAESFFSLDRFDLFAKRQLVHLSWRPNGQRT